MSDNYPVSAELVRKNGVRGIFATGGALGLMIVNGLIGNPIIGAITGGAMIIFGLGGLLAKNKDKATTVILSILAGLGVATFLMKDFIQFIIGAGAVGLLVVGGISLFKFFKGIKSRA